ncbi:MAG: YggS family pyridoxal phosphate-dependent enzyme, partial [Candidatus Omnitrophica bacterium CG11_big_fil_rev_8_21_14_0_20_63_9]
AAKQAALGAAGKRARWHLIGHLQRNKAKDAVALFDVIHSVDSRALIEALERHAAAAHRALEVLVQVNVSGEATKFGCDPQDAASLVSAIQAGPLRLVGLMTIAPFAEDPETARPHFRRLRELRDSLDHNLKLSMGMSSDFEVAIEEGADWVRIGTAIFGARA